MSTRNCCDDCCLFSHSKQFGYIYVIYSISFNEKVLGNDNALFSNSFWKHMLANTLLLHNFKYFYVAKEDAQVCNFMDMATGAQPPAKKNTIGSF